MATFRIIDGSLQDRYHRSRAPIQLFGGGFGNGKTANSIIKALQLAKDYPGSNGLIARATLPKLNDTVRKEFIKWCPKSWIKNFPTPADKSSTCTLKNGSVINFRYIAQQGKTMEQTTSNLLSATYDWALIDQIEDPEITHKDFLDLVGRMRGQARYIGADPTMPRVGPGWMLLNTNPTRNWVYRKLVKPLQAFERSGAVHDDLIRDEETGQVMIELFEGSTYENSENLPPDFIKKMEATYHGVMRERFLLGRWGGFEGLVYPEWDGDRQLVPRSEIFDYLTQLKSQYILTYVEGFDHGLTAPSCYELFAVDPWGNVILCDGFHRGNMNTDEIRSEIFARRRKWLGSTYRSDPMYCDPSIFKRTSGTNKTLGPSVASLIQGKESGFRLVRGNNDINNGIIKVQSYLHPIKGHRNPFTDEMEAPYLYVNEDLTWFVDEIEDYYWDKDTSGEPIDKPKGGRDHALDTLRYALSKRPIIAGKIPVTAAQIIATSIWREQDIRERSSKSARYR